MMFGRGGSLASGCKPWVEALSCGLRNCKGKDLASGSVVLRGKRAQLAGRDIVSRPETVGGRCAQEFIDFSHFYGSQGQGRRPVLKAWPWIDSKRPLYVSPKKPKEQRADRKSVV